MNTKLSKKLKTTITMLNTHDKLTMITKNLLYSSQKLLSEIKPPIFSVSLKTKLTGWLFTWHNLKCAIWSQVYCCLTLTVHQCFQVNFEFLLKLLWSGQNKNNKTEQFIYESRNLSIEYYVLCDSICDVSRLGFIHEWVTTCMAMQSQNDEIPRNQKQGHMCKTSIDLVYFSFMSHW